MVKPLLKPAPGAKPVVKGRPGDRRAPMKPPFPMLGKLPKGNKPPVQPPASRNSLRSGSRYAE